MAIKFLVEPGSFLLVEQAIVDSILLVESDLAPYIWRNVSVAPRRTAPVGDAGVRESVGPQGRRVRVAPRGSVRVRRP